MNHNDKEWMKNELEKFIVENDKLHKRIKELEEELEQYKIQYDLLEKALLKRN